MAAKQQRRPYAMVFCGVNGVGKSTNLAKIAYAHLRPHCLTVNSKNACQREKERERERERESVCERVCVCAHACVCVLVYVCGRAR
jgi:predicted ABC-type ATPase